MNRLPSLVVVGLMAALFLGLPGSAGAGPRHCGNTTHTDWTIVDTEAGPTAVGTDGDDVFLAWHVDGSEDMHVFGLGGDDVICAGSGDNVLSGGPGHDIIDGNVGADEIDGGPGDDILIGGDGPDLMDGRDGDDILWGAADSDSMYGGPGADDISDDGTDVVHADDVSGEPPEPPVTEPAAPRAALPPLDEPLAPTPKPTTTPAPPTPTPIPTVAPAPDPTPTPALEPAPPTPTVTAAPDPTPPAAPPPTEGVFTVVGRQILDPNGEVFYPIGANAGPPLRDTNGACVWWVSLRCSDMTGRSGNVLAWNWNTLRVNLMCQDVNLGNGQRHGPTEMFAAIDRMVDEYTSAGIVLLLECHDTLAANPPVGGDMWNDIAAFWTEAIARYGDNPYIWINFGNEFEARNDPDYWRAFTEAAYAHLRDAGYRGPMVMDLPNWAQHIQFFEDPANVEWSRQFDQVVWGWHAYGGVSEDGSVLGVQPDLSIEAMGVLYDRILANLAANEIPVLVGEFGYDWNTERRIDDGWSWISMRNSALLNMERLYDAGIGMTLWHANGSAGTFMHMGVKASDDLTFDEPTVDANLSELGEVYWQLSRRIGADRAG